MPERRNRRSDDTITALHYQLASTRRQADLEAVVLVDDSGCLVAGAGAWPVCEELAAYAPLLAHPGAIGNPTVCSRVASLRGDVEVHALFIDGCEVLLCGRAKTSRAEREAAVRRASADSAPASVLERAAVGCRRILGAA